MTISAGHRIIVALDDINFVDAWDLARKLKGQVTTFKLHEILDRGGPLTTFQTFGAVWVDLKLQEPPNKIQGRLLPYIKQGADFLTVSSFCWKESMRAAAEIKGNTKILAVGLLSSLDEKAVREMLMMPLSEYFSPGLLSQYSPEYIKRMFICSDDGFMRRDVIREFARHFALAAAESGLDGFVCAPYELPALENIGLPKDFIKIVTNVRPDGFVLPKDDQNLNRSATPREALDMGADYIVIGSPITKAPDPLSRVMEIIKEISPA